MIDETGDATDAAESLRARKTWRTLEPLHGILYFAPEAAEAYARLGITGQAGYFASPRRQWVRSPARWSSRPSSTSTPSWCMQ